VSTLSNAVLSLKHSTLESDSPLPTFLLVKLLESWETWLAAECWRQMGLSLLSFCHPLCSPPIFTEVRGDSGGVSGLLAVFEKYVDGLACISSGPEKFCWRLWYCSASQRLPRLLEGVRGLQFPKAVLAALLLDGSMVLDVSPRYSWYPISASDEDIAVKNDSPYSMSLGCGIRSGIPIRR